MCPKAGDPALRSNPPPPYKRRGRGITLVSFYSQKNQSSTGEKKTRRMHSIARLQTTEARTRTISFPPPSPSFSVPAFSNSNTSPSSSPAFLFFSFFFLFCFLSISVERPRFSWSREHVARAQFAFSWPTTGCPLFTTPSLPGPRLSTMYTQSCSSHQKAAETSTSLSVSRENVKNFRTSASYPIFVPLSLFFSFSVLPLNFFSSIVFWLSALIASRFRSNPRGNKFLVDRGIVEEYSLVSGNNSYLQVQIFDAYVLLLA